jgi:hypothetical protein
VVLDAGRVAFDGPVADGLLFYHRMMGTEEGSSASVRPPGARGELEVVELELRDADGRRRHMFRPGEELRVQMAVTCRSPAERAVAALEVRGPRGERCFRTDETIGALDGRVELSFDVPRLALLGGDYDVAVGVYDQDAPGSGLLDRVARFTVADTLDGEGIADLRGSWSVRGAGVADVRAASR